MRIAFGGLILNLLGSILLALSFSPAEKIPLKEFKGNKCKWLIESWRWRRKLKNMGYPLSFDIFKFWIGLLCLVLANVLFYFDSLGK